MTVLAACYEDTGEHYKVVVALAWFTSTADFEEWQKKKTTRRVRWKLVPFLSKDSP